MKTKSKVAAKFKLTYRNCGRLDCRRGRQKRCDFHLEHLRRYASVNIVYIFIVVLEQLARNIIVLAVAVNVIRVDFHLGLDFGTMNCLAKEKFQSGIEQMFLKNRDFEIPGNKMRKKIRNRS